MYILYVTIVLSLDATLPRAQQKIPRRSQPRNPGQETLVFSEQPNPLELTEKTQ